MSGTYTLQAGETKNAGIDFRGELAEGESLSSGTTPTVTTTSGITISNIAINTASVSILSVDVPIGKALTFSVVVDSGVSPGDYVLKATVVTDADNPQTLIERVTVTVEA